MSDPILGAIIGNIGLIILAALVFLTLSRGIRLVPQSQKWLVERLGKYHAELQPGLNLIIPFVDRVAHRVSILEQQLDDFAISVVTRDNVEIEMVAVVFYRITDPENSVYRIENLEKAIYKNTQSIVRSAGGEQELDEIQISRAEMNGKIEAALKDAAINWGCEITRTEIVDVRMDAATRESQRKQLDADRNRRAVVATAEGAKTAKQLEADAVLYDAKQRAEAVRVSADAEAYAVEVKAKADAEQTRLVGTAIQTHGQPAIDFELGKRQIEAIAELARSANTKTLILPTNVTETIGALSSMAELLTQGRDRRGLAQAQRQSAWATDDS